MGFKKKLKKFRQWQNDPYNYSYRKEERHHCQCCGEEFSGNFCPACGQRSTAGAITWRSVREGIMDVWGLGGRSLPRTLWHLLLRPGYLIGDYIGGKRQVSFPPVKMLVIVAVVVFLLINWMDSSSFEKESVTPFSDGMSAIDKFDYYLSVFLNKMQTHIDWLSLLVLSFLIYPTWVVFRYAPLHSRHTLPQGFFIQVFNSTIILIIVLFGALFANANVNEDIVSIIISVLILLQLFRTYKQLFGYSWWGTSWRLIIVMGSGILLIIIFIVLVCLVFFAVNGEWGAFFRNILNLLKYAFAIAIMLAGIHLIDRRKAKKKS